jgi:hypothetical protein
LCRFFWYVEIENINRSISYDASTIPGTQKMHSVKTKHFQNGFAFDRRNDSCFCSIFIEDIESIDICQNGNSGYVKAWRHTKLNVTEKMSFARSRRWNQMKL